VSETFDRARTRGNGFSDTRRTFAAAVRLGWQLEANWTDPFLFSIYSIAKPLASALILVVMLEVIGGPASRALRPFVVVGSALWSFVTNGVSGLAQSVLEDRERYRVLKYVYVSPADFLTVLVGRGVARIGVGFVAVLITLGVGTVALGVPLDLVRVDWPLLVVVSALGLISILGLGLLMAGVCIQARQESWSYPEAFAGALFLVTGAVFPLMVLPAPLQAVGMFLPVTWWIAGTREALFPGSLSSLGGPGSFFASIAGRPAPAPAEIVAALLVTATVGTLAAMAVFRASDQRARRAGLYDRTTGS
jgi:ABC-2 type transport system permease protein